MRKESFNLYTPVLCLGSNTHQFMEGGHISGERRQKAQCYIFHLSVIQFYHLPFHLLSFDLFRTAPPHFVLINGILLLSLEK